MDTTANETVAKILDRLERPGATEDKVAGILIRGTGGDYQRLLEVALKLVRRVEL